MMVSFPVISSDDHVFEPADLWTSRVDTKFRDRAPHVIHRDDDDTDWWVCDGLVGLSGGSGGSLLGMRFEAPQEMSFGDKIENVRLGAYLPEERLKDMDADGIDIVGRLDGQGDDGPSYGGGRIDSLGDHRIAMAFSVAALRAREAIVIDDCANVATSFPGFIELARKVGLALEERAEEGA